MHRGFCRWCSENVVGVVGVEWILGCIIKSSCLDKYKREDNYFYVSGYRRR